MLHCYFHTNLQRVSIILCVEELVPSFFKRRNIRLITHIAATTFVLVCSITVAELVNDLGDFFELVGGVSASGIGFMYVHICGVTCNTL